jgi:phosphoribosylanthranilate isomerase
MPTEIKICGLSEAESVDAALEAGADLLGFVFFAKSPRNIAPDRAAALAERARGRATIVALTVDAEPAFLADLVGTVRPDLLQLHGRESPERVEAIRRDTGLPVMKAIGIASAADLDRVRDYPFAETLLLDAKPPEDATRPGGNGAAFDWTLLRNFRDARPWLLSGGLDAANVAAALAATGAPGVDVSSGVESAPGRKDPPMIRDFIAAVRAADAALADRKKGAA